MTDPVDGVYEPYEPLHLSAPLAHRYARTGCHRDAATGTSCCTYHSLWQYLRLLGLITTVRADHDFFAAHLRPLLRTARRPRILISGSADYGLLAQLATLLRAEQTAADITVLDLCPTPLFLNHWYADHIGLPIQTVASDIFAFRTAEPFDLICTHSFLGRFAPHARQALVAHWQTLLAPGGRVVTTNRVRPDGSHAKVGYTPAQAATFCAEVRQRALQQREQLDLDPDTLTAWADEYAQHYYRYPVQSLTELHELFSPHFRLEHLTLAAAEERRQDRSTGPADARSGRARIVAVREA